MLVKYGFFVDHLDLVDLPATNISVISDLTEIYEQMRKVMTLKHQTMGSSLEALVGICGAHRLPWHGECFLTPRKNACFGTTR